MDDNVQEPTMLASTRREYSGRPHTLLVQGPFVIGWLASAALVPFGPFDWWINYLVVGAVWGITKPIRASVRSALHNYTNHEFRAPEFSWWTCIKDTYLAERQAWKNEPWELVQSITFFTVGDALLWPAGTYVMAMIDGPTDRG